MCTFTQVINYINTGIIMAVTASQIKSLNGKPRDKVLEKSDRDSLTIMVSKKGKISFYVRFRIRGKQQRMSLGSYPELSLSEAREKVLEIKKDILNNKDPRSSRKQKTESRINIR
jgi:hypothetical protein